MSLTLEQIRQQGLDALRKKLGRAGMVRFLQQCCDGKGDYAHARHEWVDRLSLDDLRKMNQGKQSVKKRRKV